jgi:hypothetical protein
LVYGCCGRFLYLFLATLYIFPVWYIVSRWVNLATRVAPSEFAAKSCSRSGFEDQGLYRVVGVASKVTKLLTMGLDKRKAEKMR